MNNKKKIVTLATGIIAIVIIVVICIAMGTNYNHPDKKDDTEYLGDFDVSQVDETISDKEFENIIDYMNTFDSVGFVKSITERTYNEDGIDDLLREEYIVSEVNLLKGEDNTLDYLQTSDTFEEKVNFKEIFGVNIKDYYEPFLLADSVAKYFGFNTEYTNAHIVKELYNYTGQKSYKLKNYSKILQQIKDNLNYDEILDSYAYFTITDAVTGDSYISSITAQIIYKKDDLIHERNFVLIIQVYNQDGSNYPNGDLES